jgi:trans-2,3-dihydro-3-hydroxyanthranilate isomerase
MRRFHVVDVFAERRYGGNPLFVVVDAEGLATETMQAIARETNLSETTFVGAADASGAFRVRIFTPAEELPFAGHPTLGTAWVIRHHVAPEPPARVTLALGVGAVPVDFEPAGDGESELAWLTAPPVELGASVDPERIAPCLGLSPRDLDPTAPVQLVAAGPRFVFVPLRALAALQRSRLDARALAQAVPGAPANVYLFCRETLERANDLHVRLFFEAGGLREDPATGSAAACLGAYLLAHGIFDRAELALRLEQGHEIGRPSLLRLRARRVGGRPEIAVGGRVIPAARGELL